MAATVTEWDAQGNPIQSAAPSSSGPTEWDANGQPITAPITEAAKPSLLEQATSPLNVGHLRSSIEDAERKANGPTTLADAQWRSDHPHLAAVRSFVNGVGADAAKTFLSPVGLALAATGGAGDVVAPALAEAVPAIAPAMRAVTTAGRAITGAAGTGAALQGVGDAAIHPRQMPGENDSDYQKRLLGDAASAVGGGSVAAHALPTVAGAVSDITPKSRMAEAGGLLQSVAHDANQIPVKLDNAGDAALKLMDWQKKTQLGPTVNKFLNRITNPKLGPMTYEEARQFYQVLGKLSSDETMKMAGPVRRDLVQMVTGLKQDIGAAADTVGRAGDYFKGMGDYATAAKHQGWYDMTKDAVAKEGIGGLAKGIGMAGAGALGYALYKDNK